MDPCPLRLRVAALFLLVAGLVQAESVDGRVCDGRRGIPGVRVYPDRARRLGLPGSIPVVMTDQAGRFRIEVEAGDGVLALEKDGWQRDLVPRSEWGRPVLLRRAPEFRRERVVVVRLEFQDEPARLDDTEIRRMLFSREAGIASASNYLYEVSKGSLILEEGRILHVQDLAHPPPRTEAMKEALTRVALGALRRRDLRAFDAVDNRTGALHPDGKPDHLWIIAPGPPGSVTADPAHIKASCFLMPAPGGRGNWPVVFLTEEVPLGNVVHEAFHAMGEHRVDDLYKDCDDPATAGVWDLMDAGQYRGWDAHHPDHGPWREDTGYSPSHPGPWVRTELWYRGRFAPTVRTLRVKGRSWEGWLDPIVRAPGGHPQRLVMLDPAQPRRFWEFWVSRPWGFEAGRVGGRFGPGHQGLVVARVDPHLLSPKEPRGPVRVMDAHPGSPEPIQPRFPCGRFELDDAAFNLGPGENSEGRDGPLAWEVLEEDSAGRLRIRVHFRKGGLP